MLRWGEIKQVYDEIYPFIIDGQIQKVRQPSPTCLALFIRSPGRTTKLILSVRTGVVRMAVSESSITTLPAPTALGAWVRACGGGRRITAFTLNPKDRIVDVQLAEGRLVAELTGSTANLYGLDLDGRLVTTAKPIPKSRGLSVNDPYQLPSSALRIRDEASRFENALTIEVIAQHRIAEANTAREETERRKLLKRARNKLSRLQSNIDRDAQRCERADDLQRCGELLKGQLYRFVKGQDTVELQDWYKDGLPMVKLSVDPRLDGPANVERLFKQYRRARDGLVRVQERSAEVDKVRSRLEALEERSVTLEELERGLRRLGLIKRMAVSKSNSRRAPRLPYRRFTSVRNEPILVGRGGADNHETTFRHARGNDFWLHVRDVPGAHVIVPCPKKSHEPHPETMLDATALAVHYSRLRGETGVDVTVTQRKHVRAIKGGAPGRVTIAAAKTMTCRDSETRIGRLFDTSDDL